MFISMGRCGEGWVEVWNRRSEERVEEGGDGMILPLVVFGHDAKRGFVIGFELIFFDRLYMFNSCVFRSSIHLKSYWTRYWF